MRIARHAPKGLFTDVVQLVRNSKRPLLEGNQRIRSSANDPIPSVLGGPPGTLCMLPGIDPRLAIWPASEMQICEPEKIGAHSDGVRKRMYSEACFVEFRVYARATTPVKCGGASI